ncbi:polysaccharide deacetylase family protein [Legionella shakespearei]|uniref:Polysaccharide deacetylase n=1 Tax=Legionella shakespearei DSM 23087 TaxID=1122169 RepID=A0A0W0YHI1_9GAMM|nr:polysaccharide deacetylase family protein [Legionella shakespearei]KTD56413.1 polysaccharide deacetylase [Legionella shakespearei DSM 23087]
MKIKLVTKNIIYSLLLLLVATHQGLAQKKVAITIDDLPFVGEYRNFHLNMMMTTMKDQHIPATGFIIASEVRSDNWEILQKFRDAGFGLGNHTFSHANLNRLETKEYIREIAKADKLLSPVMTEPKYFRYPYLAMSSGEKKNKVLCYLAKHNYQVAPITVDSKDFVFNQRLLAVPELDRRAYLHEMKPFYIDFIWQQTVKAEEHTQYHHNPDQAQILLIHANLLNAYVLPDIINLYKEKGYTFVSLEEALGSFKETAHCPQMPVKTQLAKKEAEPKTEHNDNSIESFVDWD